jgi:hypothetical protein
MVVLVAGVVVVVLDSCPTQRVQIVVVVLVAGMAVLVVSAAMIAERGGGAYHGIGSLCWKHWWRLCRLCTVKYLTQFYYF